MIFNLKTTLKSEDGLSSETLLKELKKRFYGVCSEIFPITTKDFLMFSHEAKKKSTPEGLDFVTPIVEIITDLVNALLQLLGLGIQYGINHYKSRKALVRTIEQKELKSTKSTLSVDDLGYSISRGKPISFSGIDFSKHTAIFGAADFGKTNLISILQENSLQNNRPIIFFDPKGDLEALLSFKSLCEKYQKKCLIFSEHYKDSINLNPVKNGSVNQIVDRIMTSFDGLSLSTKIFAKMF